MAHEQSKAAKRRARDWHYTNLYFVGAGLDVGAGPDGLSKIFPQFYPLVTSVRDWDLPDGDATKLDGVEADSLDFVSASHVLEHLEKPEEAINKWLYVTCPGGHVIITVPDSVMYERGFWPSRYGVGHQHRYTTCDQRRWETDTKRILDLLLGVWMPFSLERLLVIRENFEDALPPMIDQTMGPAECAIEFVLRRSPLVIQE